MARDKKISLLMRWHRRIGLTLILIITLLAVTGVLINHTSELKLSSVKLNSPLLLKRYGIESHQSSFTGFHVLPGKWLAASESENLFLNQQRIANCSPPLLSAVSHNNLLLALCKEQLLLITNDGLLAETIGTTLGLPSNSSRLTVIEEQLIIETSKGLINFNTDNLSATEVNHQGIIWPIAEPLPVNISSNFKEEKPSISLETVVLDIHSGRILGFFGVILMDIATVLLLILALSGVWAWFRNQKLKQNS